MWFFLMLLILATNGMSAFGLRVIADWGLPETAKYPYLTLWYGAGLLCSGAYLLRSSKHRISLKEFGWGALMALLSIGGQVATASALNMHVPGNVAFPVTMGGAIIIVGVAGWLFFGEKMNRMTTLGTALGFTAVILLSLS